MGVLSNSVSELHCVDDVGGFWTAGALVDPASGRSFVWKVLTSNGTVEFPMSYAEWSPGQPNNYADNEECVTVGPDYKWHDAPCFAKLCYMCEYETVMPYGFSSDCSGII